MTRNDEKMRVLKVRGDGLLAVLTAVQKQLITQRKLIDEMEEVIKQTLEATEKFDRDNGLIMGDVSQQTALVHALRNNVPNLKDKSDEEILALFGASK